MELPRTWSHEQVSSFASLIHSILKSLALITLVETFSASLPIRLASQDQD